MMMLMHIVLLSLLNVFLLHLRVSQLVKDLGGHKCYFTEVRRKGKPLPFTKRICIRLALLGCLHVKDGWNIPRTGS